MSQFTGTIADTARITSGNKKPNQNKKPGVGHVATMVVVGELPSMDLDLTPLAEIHKQQEGALARLGDFRTQMPAKLPDWVKWYYDYQAADKADQVVASDRFRVMRGKVVECLGVKNQIVKAEVLAIYGSAMLEFVPREWDAFHGMLDAEERDESRLPGLITIGLVEKATRESDDAFAVGPKAKPTFFRFLAEAAVAKSLAALARGVVSELKKGDAERFRCQLDEFHEMAEVSCSIGLLDLYTGKVGRAHVVVPEGSYMKRGEAVRLPGGEVILESFKLKPQGVGVKVIAAVGSFARGMNEIATSGTFLNVAALRSFKIDLRESNFPQEKQIQMIKLHSAIRRALEADKARRDDEAAEEAFKQLVVDETAEMEALAPTASEEAFLLDDAVGIAVIHLPQWSVKRGESTPAVQFAAERDVVGDIRLIGSPKRLAFLFEGRECEKFVNPAADYRGLASPLGAMLRDARNRAQNAREKRAGKPAEEQKLPVVTESDFEGATPAETTE